MYDLCLSYDRATAELRSKKKRNAVNYCIDANLLCKGSDIGFIYKNEKASFTQDFQERHKEFCAAAKVYPNMCDHEISQQCNESKSEFSNVNDMHFEKHIKAVCNHKDSFVRLENSREFSGNSCARGTYSTLRVAHSDRKQKADCSKANSSHDAQEINTGSDSLLFVSRNINLGTWKDREFKCFSKKDNKAGEVFFSYGQFDVTGSDIKDKPSALCTIKKAGFFGDDTVVCKRISRSNCEAFKKDSFWEVRGPEEVQDSLFKDKAFKRYLASTTSSESANWKAAKKGTDLEEGLKNSFRDQYAYKCESMLGPNSGMRHKLNRVKRSYTN